MMEQRTQSVPARSDVLIIGGGPAGLTAAIYLVRFHLHTILIDNGRSRAATIPVSHNHAGHPAGISGEALLDRMRVQAQQYGAMLIVGDVAAVMRKGDEFVIDIGHRVTAPRLLLATGVRNNPPQMPTALHDEAVARGLLRYCPVCDGYEVTDKRIGVIGSGKCGTQEALFLRSYSRDVTLIAPDRQHQLDGEQRSKLDEAGIAVIDGPVRDFALNADTIGVHTAIGPQSFDTIYPALGTQVHSGFARQLGAALGDNGGITVDSHQRTSVPGLYAAGDVVLGLDQISHAMGEASVAATTIRNDYNADRPLRR